MAEKLDTYDFARRGPTHPWDEWTDGSIWKVKVGEDFGRDEGQPLRKGETEEGRRDRKVKNFSQRLYKEANKREGIKVKVSTPRTEPDVVIFQFYEDPA